MVKSPFENVIIVLASILIGYMLLSIVYLYIAVGENWDLVFISFLDMEVIGAILISISSSFIVGGLAVVSAIPIAYLFAYKDFRGKDVLKTFLIDLPQTFPPVTEGLVYLLLFERIGLAYSFTAVLIAKFYVSAPFAINFITRRFTEIKESGLDIIARSLGANTYHVLGKVLLPLSSRDFLAGFSMTWARSMGELAATMVFAGAIPWVSQTLPAIIFLKAASDRSVALAASVIAESLSIIALLSFKKVGGRKQ
nr:ABC transporter permease subunit [Candidatus Sigynarchaeota archaeon]